MNDEAAIERSAGTPVPPPPAPDAVDPSAAYPPPTGPAHPDEYSPNAPALRPPLEGLAVAALLCGILGLAPAAIVLGHVGLVRARRSGRRGGGFAIAGFVLGYLVVVLAVLGFLAYTAFVSGLRADGYLPG